MATVLSPEYKPEQMPEWTEEDFSTSAPFEWLYERRADSFALVRWVDRASARARSFGIRNFKKQWDEYQKMQLRNSKAVLENSSDYEGQPLELSCGEYTCNDYVGVRGVDQYGNDITVCSHPIMPAKRMMNIDTNEVQIEIAYRRGRNWQRIVQDKTVLANASKIVQLSAYGIGVDSENARSLVKYFTAIEALNYESIPEITSVGHLGWIADGQFAPYVEGLQFGGDLSYRSYYDAVTEHGSEALWLEKVGAARLRSKALQILLAASLASVLVEPTNSLPFFLHLWGGTSAGKTVGLLAAASIWANPSQKAGYVRTFDATQVGLEVSASVCGSLPLMLDELQIAKDRKSFDNLIYMLTEGQSRTRGAKSGGLQTTRTWRNAIMTTGEMPIINQNSGGGAMNRVIEIDCKDEKLFADPVEMAALVKGNYGFIGKRFVEILMNGGLDKAKLVQKDVYAELLAENISDKQAASASLIAAADIIADEYIYHSGHRLTVEDMKPYLASRDAVDVNKRALEWFYGFVAANANRFYRAAADVDKVGEIWGEYDETKITMVKAVFDRVMNDAGFSAAAFLSWAKREGLLETSQDRERCVKKKRIHGGVPTWCVVLKIPEDRDVSYDIGELDNDLPM